MYLTRYVNDKPTNQMPVRDRDHARQIANGRRFEQLDKELAEEDKVEYLVTQGNWIARTQGIEGNR